MNRKIGIIGCGNMGQAILEAGLKKDGLHFLISEIKTEVIDKIKDKFRVYLKDIEFKDISTIVKESDIIIIAVKPQDIEIVLNKIRQALELCRRKPLIISIAAGVRIDYLEKKLGIKVRVIRAMPNIAVTVEEGITVLKKGKFANNYDLKLTREVFSCLGKTLEVNKEELIDAVTVISGSGPAYVSYVIEAMLKTAKDLGLDKASSCILIYQTFLGTLKILERNNFDTQSLILKVASKGGTTQRALEVFERYKLKDIIHKAIISAYKRAKELSNLK